MKKICRCGLSIIMVIFIMSTQCVYALAMSIPVYAYEGTEFRYVYDDGEELKEETQEELQNTLTEFWNQTNIKVIIVTLQDEKGKTGREITEKAMQEYAKEDVIVVLFSLNRKIINCSYENIDIFPYIKNIMSTSEEEYNTFIKNAVNGIIKQIAQAENKKFSTQTENTNVLNLLIEESLISMLKIMLAVVTVIIIAFLVLVLVIYIIVLCIKNLINIFSS